jgi:uncharacterized protein
MQDRNVEVVQRLYAAFREGDGARITAALSPDVTWHSSGTDETSGTFNGRDEVLGHLFGGAPMDAYDLEVVDVLTSEERVAVLARTSARRGEHRLVGDFVQVLRVAVGAVVEVWDYKWDQAAAAQFSDRTAQAPA